MKPRYKMMWDNADMLGCQYCCFDEHLNTCRKTACTSKNRTDNREVYFIKLN